MSREDEGLGETFDCHPIEEREPSVSVLSYSGRIAMTESSRPIDEQTRDQGRWDTLTARLTRPTRDELLREE